jgi:hypothetical protein
VAEDLKVQDILSDMEEETDQLVDWPDGLMDCFIQEYN